MARYKQDNTGKYYIDQRIDGVRCHLRASTEKELAAKIKKWKAAQLEQLRRGSVGVRFDLVARDWKLDASARLRPDTMAGYAAATAFLTSYFGSMTMDEIEPYHVSGALQQLAAQNMSRKTIANYRSVLSQIFVFYQNEERYHRKGDKVLLNPVSVARMPANAKKSKERQPPTEEQLQLVKEHPEGFGWVAHLYMYTGLRRSELAALRACDIYLDKECCGIKGCIHVHRAATFGRGNHADIGSTKTEAGERFVPIFSPLRPILEQQLQGLAPEDYLLSRSPEPLTLSRYKWNWDSYCASIGMAHQIPKQDYRAGKPRCKKDGSSLYRNVWAADVTAHQFRHYMATACYEAGLDELVATEILGHASISTTHRIYTHLRQQLLQKNAGNLEKYFSKLP